MDLSQSIILTQVMMRYFDPEEYNSQGYSTPIIMDVNYVYPEPLVKQESQKTIAKAETSVYGFKLLDTSAITLIDFSTEYTNYAVDQETTRVVTSTD